MAVATALGLLPELRAAVTAPPTAATADLVARMKVLMTEFPGAASAGAAASAEETALGREILELALLIAIGAGDLKSFERNYAQLKPLYAATFAGGGASVAAGVVDGRRHVVGLYLMHLLNENRLPGLFSEVELLSDDDRASPYIACPIRLEAYLSEGSYNKILEARASLPSPHYAHFMGRLMSAAREDIADCAAASYDSLSLAAAQSLLMFDTPAALREYLATAKPDWVIEGGSVRFAAGDRAHAPVEALTLLANTMHYATELERIV